MPLGVWLFTIFLLFKVPSTVIKVLESLRTCFFWGAIDNDWKISQVNSEKVLNSKDKSGFGIGSLKVFNYALLLKWRWRLHNDINSIWEKVITGIHGLNADLHHLKKKPNGSIVWTHVSMLFRYLRERNIIYILWLRKCIRNGECTHFGDENQLGDGILIERFPRLFAMETNKECFVGDILVNGQWGVELEQTVT